MISDVAQWCALALGFLFLFGSPVACWWDLAGRKWIEKRRLIKLARAYAIEYVPGEDLTALRGRVIERRDALLDKP
jgi:hypothetical protein